MHSESPQLENYWKIFLEEEEPLWSFFSSVLILTEWKIFFSHLHIYLGFRFVIMWYCSMCRHNVIIIVWTCHKCHNSDLQSIQHIFTTAKELIYIVHQWYSNGKITLLNVTWCRHSVCTDGLTLSCWILTVTDTAGNLDQCSNEFIKSLISSKALHFHQDSHGI